LAPAQPGADPISFLAWVFNPIFQAMFIVLVAVYDFLKGFGIPAAIGWAIVVLTLLVRAIVIPLYRRQLVSQRRTQLLQPEIKEIQRRYKGDAMKARLAQQELFKERGISPLAGCLPLLLQMPLLFIMYSVIQNGLTNVDPTAMLKVFGQRASIRSSRSSARRSTSASRRPSSTSGSRARGSSSA
jgi:membrane protein insertase Oxa1/YidC/SpoIIIJ